MKNMLAASSATSLALLLTLTSLAGCATPAERRNERPEVILQSTKNTKDVAMCIIEKWENTKPAIWLATPLISSSMKPNGFSVMGTHMSTVGITNTALLADVVETAQGSTTTYYKAGTGGLDNYDNGVRQCQ